MVGFGVDVEQTARAPPCRPRTRLQRRDRRLVAPLRDIGYGQQGRRLHRPRASRAGRRPSAGRTNRAGVAPRLTAALSGRLLDFSRQSSGIHNPRGDCVPSSRHSKTPASASSRRRYAGVLSRTDAVHSGHGFRPDPDAQERDQDQLRRSAASSRPRGSCQRRDPERVSRRAARRGAERTLAERARYILDDEAAQRFLTALEQPSPRLPTGAAPTNGEAKRPARGVTPRLGATAPSTEGTSRRALQLRRGAPRPWLISYAGRNERQRGPTAFMTIERDGKVARSTPRRSPSRREQAISSVRQGLSPALPDTRGAHRTPRPHSARRAPAWAAASFDPWARPTRLRPTLGACRDRGRAR